MPLSAGDIAFVGFNADVSANGKSFAFVALASISAGEVIHFTDNGWLATNALRTGEGFTSWTAPAGGVAAGTVVSITGVFDGGGTLTSYAASTGSLVLNTLMNFSTGGDQVIAFQGSVTSSTSFVVSNVVAALNNEGAAVWQANADNTNTSALPLGLTNGTDAGALSELDNYIYAGAEAIQRPTPLPASLSMFPWQTQWRRPSPPLRLLRVLWLTAQPPSHWKSCSMKPWIPALRRR
jgi:uncharacterized protein